MTSCIEINPNLGSIVERYVCIYGVMQDLYHQLYGDFCKLGAFFCGCPYDTGPAIWIYTRASDVWQVPYLFTWATANNTTDGRAILTRLLSGI